MIEEGEIRHKQLQKYPRKDAKPSKAKGAVSGNTWNYPTSEHHTGDTGEPAVFNADSSRNERKRLTIKTGPVRGVHHHHRDHNDSRMATGKMSPLLLLPWFACLSFLVLCVSGQGEPAAGEEGWASPLQNDDPSDVYSGIPQEYLSNSLPLLEMDTTGDFIPANGLLRSWDSAEKRDQLTNTGAVSGNGEQTNTLLFCVPRRGLQPLCIYRPVPGDPSRPWDRPGQRTRQTRNPGTVTGGGLSLNCNYTSPSDPFHCKYRGLLIKVMSTLSQPANSRTHARFSISLYRARDGQVCKIMNTTPACVTSINHFTWLTQTPDYVNEYNNIRNAYHSSQVPAGGVCSHYAGAGLQTSSILSFQLTAATCPSWNGSPETTSRGGRRRTSLSVCTSHLSETCGH